MKLLINREKTLDVIGCGHLSNGRMTIMMHSNENFAALSDAFDGIEAVSAEQPRGVEHYAGKATLIAIHRNEGSDIVSVTMSGLDKIEKGE